MTVDAIEASIPPTKWTSDAADKITRESGQPPRVERSQGPREEIVIRVVIFVGEQPSWDAAEKRGREILDAAGLHDAKITGPGSYWADAP
jgi:hypothetical protein